MTSDATIIYTLFLLNRSSLHQTFNQITGTEYNISSNHANKLASPKPIDPLLISKLSGFLILYAKNDEH